LNAQADGMRFPSRRLPMLLIALGARLRRFLAAAFD
jgi:hypothetical protein